MSKKMLRAKRYCEKVLALVCALQFAVIFIALFTKLILSHYIGEKSIIISSSIIKMHWLAAFLYFTF